MGDGRWRTAGGNQREEEGAGWQTGTKLPGEVGRLFRATMTTVSSNGVSRESTSCLREEAGLRWHRSH